MASRSLATMAADRLLAVMAHEGPDTCISEYYPDTSDLLYRDPVYYREMLDCVNDVQMTKLVEMMDECLAYSLQIDGSVSKQMVDYKFVSARLAMPHGEIKTVFMMMSCPEQQGAQGLLEAVTMAMASCEKGMQDCSNTGPS